MTASNHSRIKVRRQVRAAPGVDAAAPPAEVADRRLEDLHALAAAADMTPSHSPRAQTALTTLLQDRLASPEKLAAIDRERLSRHPRCRLAAQEQGGIRNLLGRAKTPPWD